MKQIRIKIDEVGSALRNIISQLETWEEVVKRYPAFEHVLKEKDY